MRFFAAVPRSLLKFSAGIPEGPGKSLKSDFPQEESLKVTILTGGVSPNLAGKTKTKFSAPMLLKRWALPPPINARRPLGRPGGHKIHLFSLSVSKVFLNFRFLVAVANPVAPGQQKRSLKHYFGHRLGANLAPNWR